jgi:hypothetical protein
LKQTFVIQRCCHFMAFNIVALQANILPDICKEKVLSAIAEYKQTEFVQTAFKDVRIYLESIGKPISQFAVMLMQPT